jgi:branched-chain amino acid transport system substrate-binding protein
MQTIYSFLLLLIFTNVVSCKKENTIKNTTITIGGLFSLTGNWASLGIASQEAMSLAIKDINSYMVQTGSTYRFSMSVFDTKLDTVLAQVALKEAFSKNIHSVIGPQSSSELGAIRSFANANNILVVSQGSTASNLAIADDAIFRFCPGDKVEGKALSQTIYAKVSDR